jgi:hypothetical protein
VVTIFVHAFDGGTFCEMVVTSLTPAKPPPPQP